MILKLFHDLTDEPLPRVVRDRVRKRQVEIVLVRKTATQ